MGALQERITTTNKGSITSVQAIYVPADDLTDPAPATSFAHLDATTVLSRSIAEKGIYPAVDPLDSTSRMLSPAIVGEEHYDIARKVQSTLQRYKSLQDIIAILGMDELSEEDKLDGGPRPQDRALPVAALPRRRSLHRLARQARRRSPTRSRASRASSTANTTICPRPPSTWSAPSRKRSKRPPSSPRKRRNFHKRSGRTGPAIADRSRGWPGKPAMTAVTQRAVGDRHGRISLRTRLSRKASVFGRCRVRSSRPAPTGSSPCSRIMRRS